MKLIVTNITEYWSKRMKFFTKKYSKIAFNRLFKNKLVSFIHIVVS